MTLEQKINFLISHVLDKQELDKYDAQILVYVSFLKPSIEENLMYLADIPELIKYSKFLRQRCIETKDFFVFRFLDYNPLSSEILQMISEDSIVGYYWVAKTTLVQQHNVRWWHYYHLHRHLAYF